MAIGDKLVNLDDLKTLKQYSDAQDSEIKSALSNGEAVLNYFSVSRASGSIGGISYPFTFTIGETYRICNIGSIPVNVTTRVDYTQKEIVKVGIQPNESVTFVPKYDANILRVYWDGTGAGQVLVNYGDVVDNIAEFENTTITIENTITVNYDMYGKSENILTNDFLTFDGYIDSTTGLVVDNSGTYHTSGFVKIQANDILAYSVKAYNPDVALVAIYDNDMQFVSAIATGTESYTTTGKYTALADGYVRVCEYEDVFSSTSVYITRHFDSDCIEIFENDDEIKELSGYLKNKGIIDSNGVSRYDHYNLAGSSYYYSDYILCRKDSIIEYDLTLYNTDISAITVYNSSKQLVSAICGNSSGKVKGYIKISAGQYVRYCYLISSNKKAYIYTEDYTKNVSFDDRPFKKAYIQSSDGQVVTGDFTYSVTPFIKVSANDIVNYLIYSYNSDISLIALYDTDLTYVESIVSGSSSNSHRGKYTFESGGYIKISSYGYTYSEQVQFVQTNSSALMPCGIEDLNQSVLPALIQAKSRARTIPSEYWTHADIFTLLHFSDIHENLANIDRIVKYRQYLGGRITDAVCTGDMVYLKFSDGYDWWGKFGAQSVLTCIGNHDCTEGAGGSMISEHTQTELYERYIEPYLTSWSGSNMSVVSEENKSYYYKDYTYYKIRLISINDYLTDSEATEQNTWLQTALAGAKTNGYTVVILTHQNGQNLTKMQCTFTSQTNIEQNSRIAAYEASVQSFIDNGGDFACWLCGHTHADYILKSTVYPKQIYLCVTTAMAEDIIHSDANRPYGGKQQDAFNLVSIDRTSKLIKVIRVGQDKDWMLRRLETLVIDYDNTTIISNN